MAGILTAGRRRPGTVLDQALVQLQGPLHRLEGLASEGLDPGRVEAFVGEALQAVERALGPSETRVEDGPGPPAAGS